MQRRVRFFLQSLFLLLTYSLLWLSLWVISFYLSHNGQQAALFLPQGLRLALFILLWRRFWLPMLLAEWGLYYWLTQEQLITHVALYLSPLISLLVALEVQRIWWRYPLYWQRLTLLITAVGFNSLLQAFILSFFLTIPTSAILLASITGGILLAPFVFLLYEYLRELQNRALIAEITPEPPLRTSLLMWVFLFCLIGLSAQFFLTPEIDRLLVILVFIPNVFMAYRYGWQGGVLSALLGSLMITFARQVNGAFADLHELEMFLTTQAIIGIGLGIAISRQQQLAHNLRHYQLRLEQELHARRALMEQLVHTEEDVKKAIARELHDEIGQNITAIQIQSMLVKRSSDNDKTRHSGEQIERLAQQIHQSTRQLLRQLRPPILEEMSLEKALHHLIDEFSFHENGIRCHFHYALETEPESDTIIFTLYRLVQELLNNISKHANASEIHISLTQHQTQLRLVVHDNGIGILPTQPNSGFGLRGIEERIRALGGEWEVISQLGTKIIVNLPTNSIEKREN
ncbi:MASE1 domain-containing sensor histidine kinase [Proteus mirabilis]|uniref:MASE1 domain-containing sensor histidine kinase n=1 Tax=Proteus mirabilis TaxID=584 RepID=UPI0034E55AD8